MALFINTNINSLNAQRNLTSSQSDLSTALQRLSSGLRINSAKDDAAGLAIATRFTTQINGLDQAVRNANDGVSLSQTAESALSELTNNLQRIRELAVESANATNSPSDRKAIDQEVQQRISEIDRIATQTTFNGLRVLDGSFGHASFQVGANVGQMISINLDTGVRSSQIGDVASTGAVDLSTAFTGTGTAASVESTDLSSSLSYATVDTAASVTSGNVSKFDYSGTGNDESFTVDGYTVNLTGSYTDIAGLASEVENQLDTAAGSDAYTVSAVGSTLKIETTATGAGTTITATDATSITFGAAVDGTTDASANASFDVDGTTVTLDQDYADVDALVADVDSQLGTDYKVTNDAGKLKIETAATGSTESIAITNSDLTFGTPVDGTGSAAASLTLDTGDLTIQVGDGTATDITGTFTNVDELNDAIKSAGIDGLTAYVDGDDKLHLSADETLAITGDQADDLGFDASYAVDGSLDSVDVQSVAGANDAILRVDAALESVSSLRSTLGAIQNRFESTISNLQAVSQNLSAARSRIQDADFAKETAALTRAQILQNAGISVLAQANAAPQSVLKLLG